MATLLQALEEEVGNLTTRTRFEAADLEEANATIFDQLGTGDFPVCLVLPFDIPDDRTKGSVTSTAELNVLFLNRFTNEETIDKPYTEIENTMVAPMRTLTREFINLLDDNDIINEDGITSVVHRSVHQPIGDATLYGNWAVFTIKFTEGLTLCPPH
jgi:hypothetical protein